MKAEKRSSPVMLEQFSYEFSVQAGRSVTREGPE